MKKAKRKKPSGPPSETGTYLAPSDPFPLLQRIVLVLVFGLLLVFCIRQPGNPDIGFQLKAGNYILSGNGWPDTDPFSYTMSDHPYVDTTWGYQVLLASAYGLFGAPGLIWLTTVMVFGMFYVLYLTARLAPVKPTVLLFSLLVGIISCEMRFTVRPELMSYFLLTIVIYLLSRYSEGLRTPLWILPLLHFLWGNIHALFYLGWGALGVFLVGLWIRDKKLDRKLLPWLIASFILPLLNPYGIRGVLFPLALLTRFEEQNVFAQSISEFLSPFALGLSVQFPFFPWLPIYTFRLFCGLALISIWWLIRQKRYSVLLLYVLFFPLAAKMIRNVPLFIIVALPGMVWAFPIQRISNRIGFRLKRKQAVAPLVLMVLSGYIVLLGIRVVSNAYYLSNRRLDRFGWAWNRNNLPYEAADYIKKVALPGRMLNHLNFGGYLMWTGPHPVFIDGRLEVVGEDFYSLYQRIFKDEAYLERTVSRFGINFLIFPYPINIQFLTSISRNPNWKLAYFDHLACIFVRAGPDQSRYIDRTMKLNPSDLGPSTLFSAIPGVQGNPRQNSIQRWLSGFYKKQGFPIDLYYRGLFHFFRKEFALAEEYFKQAIIESQGNYYEIYHNLGAVYFRTGRYSAAKQCYQVVLQDKPDNEVARRRLNKISRRAR